MGSNGILKDGNKHLQAYPDLIWNILVIHQDIDGNHMECYGILRHYGNISGYPAKYRG